jgi:hypothetical protein
MIRVERASIPLFCLIFFLKKKTEANKQIEFSRDIVEHVVGIESVSLGDCNETLWAKRSFSVNVESLSFSSALFHLELAGDAQLMTNLRLSRSKLSKDFGDASRFEAALQQFVEFLAAGRDLHHVFARLMHFGGGGESHRHQRGRRRHDLVGFRLADAFDRQQSLKQKSGRKNVYAAKTLNTETQRKPASQTTLAQTVKPSWSSMRQLQQCTWTGK